MKVELAKCPYCGKPVFVLKEVKSNKIIELIITCECGAKEGESDDEMLHVC